MNHKKQNIMCSPKPNWPKARASKFLFGQVNFLKIIIQTSGKLVNFSSPYRLSKCFEKLVHRLHISSCQGTMTFWWFFEGSKWTDFIQKGKVYIKVRFFFFILQLNENLSLYLWMTKYSAWLSCNLGYHDMKNLTDIKLIIHANSSMQQEIKTSKL